MRWRSSLATLRSGSDVVRRLLLAVEVVSPGSARHDRVTKPPRYQRNRVPEYWIVDDSSRTVERWRPGDERAELIADGTYFVVERDGHLVACGGWSKRRTLYGGDQRPVGDRSLLDPRTDAARIRAFFVAPEAARQGIGRRLLDACIVAAGEAGFRRLELMATLPGVPLYLACGFTEVERVTETLPDGVRVAFVRMTRDMEGENS